MGDFNVPDGWNSYMLKEVSKIKKGQQLNRDTLEDSGKYPVWNGGITPSGFTDEHNTSANTITISEGGNSCGFVNYCNEEFWLGGHCYALEEVKTEVSSEFLFFFLKSQERRIMSLRVGSGLPNIQKKDIGKIEVYFPSLAEQKIIANTLQTWDTAIEKTEALIAAKERQFGWLRSMMIRNCHGKAFKLEELEKENLISMGRGNVISKNDIATNPGKNPIYSSSIKNNGLFGRYARYMFNEDLITWSVDGGGDFFYRPKHKFSVTNVCGYIRVDQEQIDHGFLAAELQELHTRLTFDYQFKAHPSVIRKIYSVKIPPLAEQKRIAETLNTARQEIDLLSKLTEQYRVQKRGLMQKLLTGEWQAGL